MIQKSGTLHVPAARRLAYWNGLLSSVFPGMTVAGSENIKADWSSCQLGDITIALARSDRARVSRWHAGSATEASRRGLIHLQSNGVSITSQHGKAATLGGGDMTFCLADDPYEIQLSDRNTMLVVDFPVDLVAERPLQSGEVVSRRSPHAGMLHDFIGSLLAKDWQDPIEEDDRQVFRDLVANLVRQSFRGQSHFIPPASDVSLRERVLAFVEDNLDQSQLRTGFIANRLSVPSRAIQAVFAELATTPSAYIIERRLARAADRLRTRKESDSITDLALELGFSDCSHFTRRFKARYGVSPSRFIRADTP